ncbi:TetR/AcrR family transcriptional regulator [Streptomyces phaeochromogenes]|uniref:TetR/AcrR family transcriptional regulator n=1 Tax=Streptomyces phaeochromogenes TaxID=1923 RepID=UPI003688E590
MASNDDQQARRSPAPDAGGDYRQRAAETKRARTIGALLGAGKNLFAERGWHGTRLADVAKEAGVSVATLHNHFPTKHDLVGECYGGMVGELSIEDGIFLYEHGHTPVEIITWAVSGLVKHSFRNRNLASAMLASLHEKPPAKLPGIKELWDSVGGFEGKNELGKYGVAAVMALIADMIRIGKHVEAAEINCDLPEWEVASHYVTATLMLVCMQPSLTEEQVERIAIVQLITVLTGSVPDPEFAADLRETWYPPSPPNT